MTSDRSILEGQLAGIEVQPFTIEEFHRRRHQRQRNRRTGTVLVGLVVAAAAIGGVVRTVTSDRVDTRVTSDGAPVEQTQPGPFEGSWLSTDTDNSSQTMEIRRIGDDQYEVVVRDESALVCAGAPSTMTGTGRLDVDRALVIAQPLLTCNDGSAPAAESGPPLQEQLANLSFVHDLDADEIVDTLGVVLGRPPGDTGTRDDPPRMTLPGDVSAGEMTSIRAIVDAINARDADAFLGAFAPEGSFNSRGDFRESSSLFGHRLPVSDVDLVRAFLTIVDAWGLEAELISCAPLPVAANEISDDVESVVECAVATRWHTLSMEITEGWSFELRGADVFSWGSLQHCCLDLLDLNPSGRTLRLGYDGLEAWETWLQANRPDDAARFLNPREELFDCEGCAEAAAAMAPGDPERAARLASLVLFNAQYDWTIDGHDFAPSGLIPYDPALADEIEASIREYLDTR